MVTPLATLDQLGQLPPKTIFHLYDNHSHREEICVIVAVRPAIGTVDGQVLYRQLGPSLTYAQKNVPVERQLTQTLYLNKIWDRNFRVAVIGKVEDYVDYIKKQIG